MSEDGSVTEEDVADGHQQRALDSEGYGVEEEEEGRHGPASQGHLHAHVR